MKLITKIALLTFCIATSMALKTESSRRNQDKNNLISIINNVESKCGAFNPSNLNKEALIEEVIYAYTEFQSLQLNPEEQLFVEHAAHYLFPETVSSDVYEQFKNTLFNGISLALNDNGSEIAEQGEIQGLSKKYRKNASSENKTAVNNLVNSIIAEVEKDNSFKQLLINIKNFHNINKFIEVLANCYFQQEQGTGAVRKIKKRSSEGSFITPMAIPVHFVLFFVIFAVPVIANMSFFIIGLIVQIFTFNNSMVVSNLISKLTKVEGLAKKLSKKNKKY